MPVPTSSPAANPQTATSAASPRTSARSSRFPHALREHRYVLPAALEHQAEDEDRYGRRAHQQREQRIQVHAGPGR